MNVVKLGRLEVGRIPRVVGTLSSLDALDHFAALPEKVCDIAEARLDHIGLEGDWLTRCKIITSRGSPLILTLRSAAEGGKSTLGNEERKTILKSALPVVSAIDVEFKSGLPDSDLYDDCKAQGKVLISSFHDFEKTPSLEELSKTASGAQRRASIVKISTMINAAPDIKTLEQLLARKWAVPLCVIGMGPLGRSTRVSFPSSGSCLTYGYVDTPSAPGQLSAPELVAQLQKLLPAFDEDFKNRHRI